MRSWDVTVVIPTLPERVDLLANAINSVNAQTYAPTEVIVEEVRENEDAGVTRNRAMNRVSTEWTAFLDDDDELEPQHLQVLIDGAKESGADVIYPWFKILKQDGQLYTVDDALWLIDFDGQRKGGFGLEFNDHRKVSLKNNNFIHLCCLIRTSKILECGGFPQTNTPEWPREHGEDWGLWLRMLKTDTTFFHVPERTWHWRWWDGRTNGQPSRRVQPV